MTTFRDEAEKILNQIQLDTLDASYGEWHAVGLDKALDTFTALHEREVERILHEKGEDDKLDTCKNDGNQL